MSKHQLNNIVFGVFTIVFFIGFFLYDWSILYFLIVFCFWGLVVISGSFFIQLQYHLPVYNKFQTTEKIIALTFDDGPTEHTTKVLELLQQHQQKATFFCIGKQAQKFPDILKQIYIHGHSIGNHTFTHGNNTGFLSTKSMIEEIENADQVIHAIINKKPILYRPPFGVTNPNVRRSIFKTKHYVIGWNTRSYDTVIKDANRIYNRIKYRVKPGSIILLHDTSEKSIVALERLLIFLRENNYKSITIEDLLKQKQ